MSLTKAIFLLSLFAVFLTPRETEAQATIKDEWSKLSKCTQVAIETFSNLANKVVPTVYELMKCSRFVSLDPPIGKRRKVTWYLKVVYEFFKRIVFDEPKCLHDLLNKIAKEIKPYAEQIGGLGCLDDDDFII
ncbi:uncharacterized protein LOC108051217 [Drosophila rhopaloa]|uniref:Uncharacterized protein LOC108051217 n=1 Tax=Drosophila rhopaloa TaxID=1041015 RepID=A0A6P4FMK8_DRORH|nr:uncharacterized protein LOC108051217 [Drosophila rhopaloa]